MASCRDCSHKKEDYSTDYTGGKDIYYVCGKHGFVISRSYAGDGDYTCDDNTVDNVKDKVNFRKVR